MPPPKGPTVSWYSANTGRYLDGCQVALWPAFLPLPFADVLACIPLLASSFKQEYLAVVPACLYLPAPVPR